MTIAKRFLAPVAFVTGAMCATSAHAHLQLTYTSDQLPFLAGFLDGEPSDDAGNRNPPFPFFSVTFTSNNDLSSDGPTTLLLNNTVNYIDWAESVWAEKFTPQTPSFITLDRDGSILAWDFSLAYYYLGKEPYEPPGEIFSLIRSSYNAGANNYDRIEYAVDIFMEKPADHFIFLTTVEVHYEGLNELNNWKIESLHVPEPNPLLLVLIGTGFLAASRLRTTA